MRPKLKSDTFFIPVDEGVYVRNNEKSFTIKGKTLAAWLERLAPALDGRHDLKNLCAALPEEKRQVIEHLILKLTEQGCIKDTSHELPHTLSPAIMKTYGPAITYIDYHTDSGAARFQRFLETPVLAIGSGERLLALAHALLETGNRAISLLDSGEAETNYARLQHILQVLRAEQDDELRLNLLDPGLWQKEDQLQKMCASAGMVLYFGCGDRLALVDQLNTLCRRACIPFLPAVIWDSAIHIGPLCSPDHSACWQCLWRRRRAIQGLPAYTAAGEVLGEAEPEVRYPGKPAIGVTANILAEAFFTHCAQVEQDTFREAFSILELNHLQNVKHRLFPHPLCTTCGTQQSFADWRDMLEEAACQPARNSSPVGDQRERLESWTDEECGIFASIDYAEYHQLPLTRCDIRVPLASDIPASAPIVQAAELDYPEAYTSAGRRAVAAYAESLADTRRICWGTYAQYKDRAARPERLAGWLDSSPDASLPLPWTWGVKVAAHPTLRPQAESILVPTAAVAPRSSWNRAQGVPLFRPDLPATGVGATWHEVLADTLYRLSSALSSQCASDPRVGDTVFPIAEDAYQDDPECAAYQKILRILHARVCVVDCTDISRVPRIGVYLADEWLGVFSHWNTLCALRAALKQAVLTMQIRRTPGPNDPLLAGEDRFPLQSPASRLNWRPPRETLMPSLAAETDYVTAATALCASFEQRDQEILVVPLPVDQAVKRIWPWVLRVLVLRKEDGGKA